MLHRKERETVSRVPVLIGDYIDSFENANYLQLVHDGTTVFSHSQVWNEIAYKYNDWAYFAQQFEDYQSRFITLYNNYVENMGYSYWRMFDALQREYNPIENYAMLEAGADGHKQSQKTITDGGSETEGLKIGTSDTTRSGSQTTGHGHTITDTHTGSVTTDRYSNAFDSGITADGTHVSKEVVNPSAVSDTQTNSGTDTLTFNNVKDQQNHSHDVSDTEEDGVGSGWDSVRKDKKNLTTTEDFNNDVTLSFKKTNPDGTDTTETLGSDFADGNMYRHTRSGNIGVTTAQQMLNEELELRKKNLLSAWVEGFIREYCTWWGERE